MTPTRIHLDTKTQTLNISFQEDQQLFSLPAEYLRVFSPSAEVRGHGSPILQQGKAKVNILKLLPIGNYALKIEFDDGHDSGLFSFDYLYELATEYEQRWANYLEALEASNLSRD